MNKTATRQSKLMFNLATSWNEHQVSRQTYSGPGDSDQSMLDGDDAFKMPHERIEEDTELQLHCMGDKNLFTKFL